MAIGVHPEIVLRCIFSNRTGQEQCPGNQLLSAIEPVIVNCKYDVSLNTSLTNKPGQSAIEEVIYKKKFTLPLTIKNTFLDILIRLRSEAQLDAYASVRITS